MRPRLWFALFLVLQAADGLMTYAAVDTFGPVAEGNPLLVTWMSLTGSGPALLGAKLLASACGAILYSCGLHQILALLTALYLFGAIIPWLQVLSQVPLV